MLSIGVEEQPEHGTVWGGGAIQPCDGLDHTVSIHVRADPDAPPGVMTFQLRGLRSMGDPPPVIRTGSVTVDERVDLSFSGTSDSAETDPGGFLALNDDDDNNNGVPDMDDGAPTDNEDDLKALTLSADASLSGDVELRFLQGLGRVKIYTNDDRSGQLSFPHAWAIPSLPVTIYVEGVVVSESLADIGLELRHVGVPGAACKDRVNLTVYHLTDVVLETARNTGNLPLDNDTVNNGGKRIFPGMLSSGDTDDAGKRRTVDLVATVEPTLPELEGRWVYFKVFDVDDQFDQLYGCPGPTPDGRPCMPDVGVIDDNTTGPDNRGTESLTLPWTASGQVDANGKARVTFTVSMQPGNNYRAAASCLDDAPNQPDQPMADAINNEQPASPGSFSGYKVPVTWSQMLTVWRKLHVERDTMAAPSAGATWVTGTVGAIVPNSPVAGQAVIDLGQNLADEFSDLNLYEGGEIVFANCPVGPDIFPVLLSTSNTIGSDSVTVAGVPGACAIDSSYTLKDDDDITVLPHFPDYGQFGIDAFARAYILPLDAGTQYQTVVPFDMHVSDFDVEYGLGPWDDGRQLSSTTEFWSCLVVGCWEPADLTGLSQDFDHDPDPCPAPAVPGAEGYQSGVTDAAAGRAAVFLQVISDDAACTFSTDEVHTVTHEIAHTCGQHKPPYVPTADDNGHIPDTIVSV